MDKDLLKDILSKKFNTIHKNASKAAELFDAENIHNLRVGYKKLRTFIRLLRKKENIKIPDSLKNLYAAAGHLRNLQLYSQVVTHYCLQTHTRLPGYTSVLSEETKKAEHAFKEAVNDMPFGKIKDQLKEDLPDGITDEVAVEFVEDLQRHIQSLLNALHTDSNLHSIRKDFKDILYTFQLLDDEHLFDSTHIKEQQLKNATDTLGDYIDTCTNLSMLESGLLTEIPAEERDVLFQLQQVWTQEKLLQKTAVEIMLPGIV